MLSLEAPLVAILWLAALAHVNDLALMPGVLPGLGLSVWLIYLMDRALDTFGVPAELLSVRHRFYHRFRWPLVLGVIPLGTGVLAWLSLWVIPSGLLAHSLVQVLPIGLYLVLYSVTNSKARRWLLQAGILLLLFFINALPIPFNVRLIISGLIAAGAMLMFSFRWHEQVEKLFRKEVAAGMLFAFGCTTWTRFHTLGSDGADNWMELVFLSLLFVSNLALITVREDQPDSSPRAHGTVRSSFFVSILSLIAILTDHLPSRLLPLCLATLAGLIGLEILWQKRQQMSAEAFRVWADIVVALPAVALLLLPESNSTQAAACCL